jgi:hypothetical protein
VCFVTFHKTKSIQYQYNEISIAMCFKEKLWKIQDSFRSFPCKILLKVRVIL